MGAEAHLSIHSNCTIQPTRLPVLEDTIIEYQRGGRLEKPRRSPLRAKSTRLSDLHNIDVEQQSPADYASSQHRQILQCRQSRKLSVGPRSNLNEFGVVVPISLVIRLIKAMSSQKLL